MLILASASAGRKKLLESLGLKFEVIPANIDEEKFKAKTPLALVKKIARAKALAVAKKIGTNDSCLIIAADSMVVFRGQVYGKPKSRSEAKRLLKKLSGKAHFFVTGLIVIVMGNRYSLNPSSFSSKRRLMLSQNLDTNIYKLYQNSGISRVIFGKLTEKEISTYVKTANVTAYAGGYAPDLKGGEIIKPKMKIEGSESNVIGGIPLEKLRPILKRLRIKLSG